MGSKANDSRMGTTGLPDASGISLRLTPAPEAVISTSEAPVRTGSREEPSAAARPPAALPRSRRRRLLCAVITTPSTGLSSNRDRGSSRLGSRGTHVHVHGGCPYLPCRDKV